MRNAIHLNSIGSNCLTSAVTRWPSILKLPIVAPDELDRIAGLQVACALERPDNVFRREGRAVVPDDALAHIHPDLRLVVVPSPCGQKAGREGQVRLLPDRLIEDRAIDRLDRRIDRRGPAVGSNEGRLTLKAIVSVSPVSREGPSAEQKLGKKSLLAPSASVWRRFTSNISTLPVSQTDRATADRAFTGSFKLPLRFARTARSDDNSMQAHR